MSISLEDLHPYKDVLSPDLVETLSAFQGYAKSPEAVVLILVTDEWLRVEFQHAYDDTQGLNWRTEVVVTENEDFAVKCGPEFDRWASSDVVVVLTTALRIAPANLHLLLSKLKDFGKPTFVLLCGLQSLPQREDVLKRKVDDAHRALELNNDAQVLASAKAATHGARGQSHADNMRYIGANVKSRLVSVRKTQVQHLNAHLGARVHSEIAAGRREVMSKRADVSAERTVMYAGLSAVKAYSHIIGPEVSGMVGEVEVAVGAVSWDDVRQKLEGISKLATPDALAQFQDCLGKVYTQMAEDLTKRIKGKLQCRVVEIEDFIKGTISSNARGLARLPSVPVTTVTQVNALHGHVLSKVKDKCIEIESGLGPYCLAEAKQLIQGAHKELRWMALNKAIKLTDRAQPDQQGQEGQFRLPETVLPMIHGATESLLEAELEKLFHKVNRDVVELARDRIGSARIEVENLLDESIDTLNRKVVGLYSDVVSDLDSQLAKLDRLLGRQISHASKHI